jgi:hypothetical protein
MGVPYTFAGQAGPIPLAELDADFAFLSASSSFLTDTGTTNLLVVTLQPASGPAPIAYSPGLTLLVLAENTTTTTTPSVNLNGLGAETIVNSNGTALAVGQIVAGQLLQLVYDGTNFRLMGTSSSNEGTFTVTGVGFSGTAPTLLCTYAMFGNMVTVHFASGGVNAASNSTSFSFTGIPTFLQPSFLTQEFAVHAIDASAEVVDASVQLGTTTPGSFNMLRDGNLTGWTASGNKGFGAATITYLLA